MSRYKCTLSPYTSAVEKATLKVCSALPRGKCEETKNARSLAVELAPRRIYFLYACPHKDSRHPTIRNMTETMLRAIEKSRISRDLSSVRMKGLFFFLAPVFVWLSNMMEEWLACLPRSSNLSSQLLCGFWVFHPCFAWAFSGFLPHSKIMQGWFTEDSSLSVCVNPSVNSLSPGSASHRTDGMNSRS